jgi:hypothetical protein
MKHSLQEPRLRIIRNKTLTDVYYYYYDGYSQGSIARCPTRHEQRTLQRLRLYQLYIFSNSYNASDPSCTLISQDRFLACTRFTKIPFHRQPFLHSITARAPFNHSAIKIVLGKNVKRTIVEREPTIHR